LRRIIFLYFLFVLFFTGTSLAQSGTSIRKKNIFFTSDTLVLDSLTLIPGSIFVRTSSGALIDSADYKTFDNKIIFLNKNVSYKNDSIVISYKTFPYLLDKPLQHKNANEILKDASGIKNPFAYTPQSTKENPFKTDGLNKNGSISRGINFGNNQDVVVNSNLNLQLSGKLNDKIDILLAASDNNIPIQPDGNTQQLQDFDKVFIQLSDHRSKLIAGDFALYRPESYFLNFNKKAQGLHFATSILNPGKDSSSVFTNTVSAAVSRGKFARNIIAGIEGNQGPYRLQGAENEPFIIVLSGTEKIYIDGVLLTRGQEYDYVIDYNTSEITFTPKQFVTKDKRIVAEFQYSDKNYARSLYYIGTEIKTKKIKTGIHVYSEQDSKNKPLQQELSIEQRKLLSDIGDTLNKAVSPSIDSIAFNSSEVLYQKKDTTAGTFIFKNIYTYSTNPENAFYRLSFSFVGNGNGNYVQVNSSANGRVFAWVIPDTLTGKPRGSYEPVVLLITPKQKQVVVVNSLMQLNPTTKLYVEGALSNNDINTFSSRNSSDDIGYAFKFSLSNLSHLKKNNPPEAKNNWKINSSLNYEYLQKYFSPVERFRSVEFERDWNRPVTSLGGDQHVIGARIGLENKKDQALGYEFNSFVEPNFYNAYKNSIKSVYDNKHFSVVANGNLLNAETILNNTRFMRHNAKLVKKFRKINIGLREMQEQNRFSDIIGDTLLLNSFDFFEWEAFIQNGDTMKNKYELAYKQRTDYRAKNNKFNESTFAESIGLSVGLLKNIKHQLNTTITYRKLSISDSALALQKPDETMAGRIEYNTHLWKNAVLSNTFYEIGSGLELKKEFSFIEVAPGQGSYTWKDYNSNGVKELNEFEIAAFTDQANFIKVFTPTNNYIKTYTNQFTQMLNIRPAAVWSGKKGIRKSLSLFANQTAYQTGKKVTTRDPAIAFNPFLQSIDDSTLVSLNSSIRNTLYINQTGTVFGMDVSWQDSRNKSILVNGLDSRTNILKEIRTRWNISKVWSTIIAYREGRKSSRSEFFSTRDYFINYYETEPQLSYQPNNSFRSTVSFRYSDKKNRSDLGGQKAQLQDYGVDIRYNILNKGSLNVKSNFIKIIYNSVTNSSIAYEMLESLKPGQNFTWGVAYQRTLSNNMQVSINYDGRKTPGNKSIHTGGAQVRAFF